MIEMKLKEASLYSGVHPKTLQRLDREGKLKPIRSNTNRRVYTIDSLNSFFGIEKPKEDNRKIIIYCRVSSPNQKPDLLNQISILKEYSKKIGCKDYDIIKEIGGGLNFKRKEFNRIFESVEKKEISKIIIAHKDRLTRFGFDWFNNFCRKHECEIIILNNDSLSPEQEMVQDLMTIIHCFSSRLYGLRNYRKKLEQSLKNDKNT
jgi:predicted site-specific integrase-resolvase